MANTFNTIKDGPGIFAKGIAETLRDNMAFCAFVDKADESDFEGKNGFKAGNTIYTSIPPRFIPDEDQLDITSSKQDVTDEKKPLVLNKTATIGLEIDSLEFATETDIKRALELYGIPAAEAIAQSIETRCFQIACDATYNSVGTPGSNAFTTSDILAARIKLNQDLCPKSRRELFMNSASGAKAVDARKGLFQDSSKISEQYRDGLIGRADGFDWRETELVPTHANGNDVTGIAIDATPAEGDSTLNMDGFTANTGTCTVGSVFTIANVFKVHPITKAVTSELQQFVVTAVGAATADANGDISVTFSPALYTSTSGGLQNIDHLPSNDDVVTFVGAASTTRTQNLALHPSAFKMVTVPMITPKGVDMVATATVDGITVNIVRDFDVHNRSLITRLDVLYGFDAVRPEWSCRITA